jgi:hypothetical protein
VSEDPPHDPSQTTPQVPSQTTPQVPPPDPTPRRNPGWSEVILIAAFVLALVFAVEIASRLIPGVGDAFGRFPTTIVILVAGTLLVLLRLARRSGR